MDYRTILLGFLSLIFLISSSSAISIIAGESHTFMVNTTSTLFYDVMNNKSDLTGLTITQDIFDDYSNITLDFDILYSKDSFTLIFLEERIVEKPVPSGGGGGSRTKIIQNKSIEYVPVQEYIDREIPIDIENNDKIKDLERGIRIRDMAVLILSILSIILALFLAYFIYNCLPNDLNT